MTKVVKVLTPETIPDLAKVLAISFIRREPLFAHLKLREADFENWISKVASSTLDDGLSCVVYDSNGKAIGAAVNQRLSNSKAYLTAKFDEAQPVFDVLAKYVHPPYLKAADPHNVMYTFAIGGLLPEEGGQRGIAELVCNFMCAAAKEKGIRYATTELTSPITQHVFLDKLVWKSELVLAFADSGVPQYRDHPGKGVLAVLDLNNYRPVVKK